MLREFRVAFHASPRALRPSRTSLIFARSWGEAKRQARLAGDALGLP
ncbi:hypothetical protein RQ831_15795 [Roseomonas gilardii]|uniref:Uncharacterized protein n=2 Tax=Roseomonas TaxID=125216 RepID=A0ABU3MHR2_9PROT|nr:hypothetical protein [Roseomonas gilardii]MDT8332524.1 hypothetical protein [Roseomonas gilardii]